MATAMYRVRCHVIRETPEGMPEGKVRGPKDVAAIMHQLYDDCPQECFVAFHLNTRHEVVGFEEVTRGILDASLIHPREVFRSAIISNAAGVIVAHNHPSGDPSPSPEDRAVTRQLGKAGRSLGIPLLDHVVIGSGTDTFVSLSSELGGVA